MRVGSTLGFIFLVAALVSCRPVVPAEELNVFVGNPENGFLASKTIGNIEYQVRHKPSELVAVQSGELNNDLSNLESVLETYDDQWHFDLRIGSVNGRPPLENQVYTQGEYSPELKALMSGIQNQLFIITPSDTLNCLLHHFERSYGVAPYHTISLVFAKPSETKDVVLKYNDQLFGTGPVNINITSIVHQNSPRLKV